MARRYKKHILKPNKPESTLCICPRCSAKHQKMLFWTGRIPARKYCLSCEQIVNHDYTPEPYSLGYRDIDDSVLY